ncbi:MAG: hypothetical protein FD174_3940 [Geobacteraceae bacterium]|nr:MAG: hypothetical protein FD174_3940 [Geobacteraceae bacterium]
MSNTIERLKVCIETGAMDRTLLLEVVEEMGALRKRQNELEELLIILVRTGWPWQEDGEPNEIFNNCKDGFAAAMIEAKDQLGLEFRSMITRTEPRT